MLRESSHGSLFSISKKIAESKRIRNRTLMMRNDKCIIDALTYSEQKPDYSLAFLYMVTSPWALPTIALPIGEAPEILPLVTSTSLGLTSV